jgi:hypothetical protein
MAGQMGGALLGSFPAPGPFEGSDEAGAGIHPLARVERGSLSGDDEVFAIDERCGEHVPVLRWLLSSW